MHAAREAKIEDLGELTHLLQLATNLTPHERGGHLFGQPQRQHDPSTRAHHALTSERHLLGAGLVENAIFGVTLARVDGDLVTVEELHVEREAREVGVGEALLELVVGWARSKNAAAIDYPALPGDRATKNLGERSGFSARLILMHRRL